MILIRNGKVLTMAGRNYEHGCVLIRDGKIEEVGPRVRVPETSNVKVYDARGGLIMPGLIEAHCHLGIIEEKRGTIGDDCNEATLPATPYVRAIDAINPMDPAFDAALKAGITSVMTGPGSSNPVGGQFAFIKTKGRSIDELIVKAPAAMKCALGENPKTAFGDNGNFPSTRMGAASVIREELFRAVRYKQKKDSGNVAKEDEDYRLECWLPVLNGEIPMKVHAHRADDIHTAIRIAQEFSIDITIDHCTEGHLIAKAISASHFPAIVGPSLTSRSKIEVQNMDFKTSGVLHRNGVLVAITTDHPVSLIQYLPHCAGLAVKKGLPMEEGLKAITINAAKICRVDDRVGSIEPGKDADIAVFTGNPMEIFTETLYTFIDGRLVYSREQEKNGGKN